MLNNYEIGFNFFIIINLCVIVWGQDVCSSQFSLVSDLTQEDCPDGTYYFDKDDKGVETCFPACKEVITTIQVQCGKKPCPPGYLCSNNYCVIDEDSCMKYYSTVFDNNPYTKAMWKPKCEKDGSWAAKQCKGEEANGRCYCYNKKGIKLFGQQWSHLADNMTCACSRHVEELQSKRNIKVTIHCDRTGNYEPLQCDSGQCWCAEPLTGELKSPVVPEGMLEFLPCYDKLKVGDMYLRQCESHAFARSNVINELNIHGTKYANYPRVFCDEDGAFGPITIDAGNAYCTWRDGSKIQSWQISVNNLKTMDCNCARDTLYYEESGKALQADCENNGNYMYKQKTEAGQFYCVDSDGFQKSPLLDTEPNEDNCAIYK